AFGRINQRHQRQRPKTTNISTVVTCDSLLCCELVGSISNRYGSIVNSLLFPQNLFSGTQAALGTTGTHGRPNEKVESAPAAITSLSAVCRGASYPPRNPSVLPPEIGTQSEMAGFSRIWRPLFSFPLLYCLSTQTSL